MKPTIGILGCGWLGKPLAEHLLAEGYRVKGSTTTPEKKEILLDAGIEAFKVTLTSTGCEGEWADFIADVSNLVVAFPPKLRQSQEDSYVEKVQQLLQQLQKTAIEKLLWVGSTGVFGEQQDWVDDTTVPEPDTPSGRGLWAAEQAIHQAGLPYTGIRLGGLVGPDRHPVQYLSGRQNLERPKAPVHLIALPDCIGILTLCLQQEARQGFINAVHPERPTREVFYTQAAHHRQLPPPHFDPHDTRVGKRIACTWLSQQHYIFEPHLPR